jgi:6-phosphogluconolactonase (cycloisomerase 2 family)
LTPIGSFSTLGRTPRNFGIDKTGRRLYAGNQQSDTIVQFDIDLETGQLVVEMPKDEGQVAAAFILQRTDASPATGAYPGTS